MQDKLKTLTWQTLKDTENKLREFNQKLNLCSLGDLFNQIVENGKELIPIDEPQGISLAEALDGLQELQNDADGVEE